MHSDSKMDPVRRYQGHLHDDGQQSLKENAELRGGPKTLDELKIHPIYQSEHFLVINKGPDERLDGEFEVTIEKALHRNFPKIEKFRWIHQLDFATSGAMAIGLQKPATAMACRLFQEKRVQKEYLAVVRGHLPFDPRNVLFNKSGCSQIKHLESIKTCTFSKMNQFIQDIESFEKLRIQMKGTPQQRKHPKYPKGPRQGQAFFHMDQAKIAQLLKKKQVSDVSIFDVKKNEEFVQMKWAELTKDQQKKYHEKAAQDKLRYEQELSSFLDDQQEKLALERKYGQVEEDQVTSSNTEQSTTPRESKRIRQEHEPIAYVFDDPIAEPNADTFRMQIGVKHSDPAQKIGKASTSIAFVLGHAVYQSEPVTKILLRPLSGRRHQLRLHTSHHGFPIVGDVTYGAANDMAPRMMLHAWNLQFHTNDKEKKQFGKDLSFQTLDPFEKIVPTQKKFQLF